MKKAWSIWILYILLLGGLSTPLKAQIDTDRVISIGLNAIYFKDYVLAIQYFNSAIQNDPNRAEPYYYRGLAKFSLDDYLGAEIDSDACIERNPYIGEAYYLRAISRHSLGKDSLAIEDYKVVLNSNPDHKGALHNSALLNVAMNDTISARKALDHLQRFFPSYAPGYMIDGGLHLEQKDTITAINLFEKAIEISPDLTGAYIAMAGIAYDQSKYQKAEQYMDEAIHYDNKVPELFINRGLIRYQRKNIRGAMTDYSKAVDLAPNNSLALYNRALLRTQVGERNAAQEDFNRVLQLDPENYFALFNRAIISNEIGDYRLAISDLNKIIERYPTFVPAYVQRAEAKEKMGLTHDSKQDLYQASKLMYDSNTLSKASDLQAKADKEESEKNDVRDDRDKNIKKFKMLVYNSQQKGYNDLYKEDGIRGRVQDRDVAISPEPMYQLSYYVVVGEQIRSEAVSKYASKLELPESEYAIQVVRHVPQLSQDMVNMHLQRVQEFNPNELMSADKLLKYAMDQVTLRDHEMAIATFSLILDSMPDDPASLFQRAVSRYLAYEATLKEVDFENKQKSNTPDLVQDPNHSKEYLLKKAKAQDSIKDLETVLKLVPDYAPALYNIGYIYASLGQYIEAIEYYDRAISVEPKMGAAYYNRGLAHYSIGEKNKGDSDLSAAGNLGFYKAYSIIRRMK